MIDELRCENCGRFLGSNFEGRFVNLKCGKCGWVTKININPKPLGKWELTKEKKMVLFN